MLPLPKSRLFVAAEANLRDDHRDHLRALLTAIEALSPGDPNAAGCDIRRNIEREQQLSSNPHAAEPVRLQAFFQALLDSHCDRNDSASIKSAYKASAGQHSFGGMPISDRPPVLFRYIDVTGFLSFLAEKLLARSSDFGLRLQRLLDRATTNDIGWQRVLAFVQRPEVWAAIPREDIRLARADSMFVTFDGRAGGTPVNRNSTSTMWSALALWWPKPPALLELTLATPSGPNDLRFPTVADAGWFGWFQCAPLDATHGWTGPRDPTLPPQPELIMGTVRLSEIPDPARLRILDP